MASAEVSNPPHGSLRRSRTEENSHANSQFQVSTLQPDSLAIERWFRQRGQQLERIESLVGDVSPRRYFRLFDGTTSSILAFYPPSLAESCERFQKTSDLLDKAGVCVPEILDCDPIAGFVWLEDLGPETLYDLDDRPWSELIPHFAKAIDHHHRILGLDRSAVEKLSPTLDGPCLDRELNLAFQKLLIPSEFFSDSSEQQRFRAYLSQLCVELGRAPSAPCHRDYMARNLIVHGQQLAVIDHQDLRIGPTAYDLASLLNDSLFPPPGVEETLLETAIASPNERRHYHLAAIQRTLKAAGTFASFAQRGHPRHLPLVAPTLERTLSHLDRLEEGRAWVVSLGGRWREILRTRFPSRHQ